MLHDFEEQIERELHDQVYLSSTEVEECLPEQGTLLEVHRVATPEEDVKDDGTPISWKEEEPNLCVMTGTCPWKS